MSNVTYLTEGYISQWKRAKGKTAAILAGAVLPKIEPVKQNTAVFPAVTAHIRTDDQRLSVDVEVSGFLESVSDVGLICLLTMTNSWAVSDLLDWAGERSGAARQLLEYADFTHGTEFETQPEVRIHAAQARVWLQVHRPALARELKTTALL